MELTPLLMSIAGGGLVTLALAVIFTLLRSSQQLEDAQDEQVWQLLLHTYQP